MVEAEVKDMIRFETGLGKKIANILQSNPEIKSSIERLEKVCEKVAYEGEQLERIKNKAREFAYSGAVLAYLNGKDGELRLNSYVDGLEKVTTHKFVDLAFYIEEFYNQAFK